ncbi:hypothetical protein [Streptomyces sioyaensis]|uniref:hypothetical protein n=1 Tax=Streptomyces sioyaensis TaxID=67364 RepID=UPI00378D2E8A
MHRRPGTSSGRRSPGSSPVPLELRRGGVDLFEEDHDPRADAPWLTFEDVVVQLLGEGESAPAFLGEVDQGVVDLGDVPAVGDAGHAAGPGVGDPLEVQDVGVRAVVDELAGDAAQDGRLAAAGAGRGQAADAEGLALPSLEEPREQRAVTRDEPMCGLFTPGTR